jgi:hypothetical protein
MPKPKVVKSVIDLIAAAAEEKKLIDAFRDAKNATDLQTRAGTGGYFISDEDCKRLLKARNKIFKALETHGQKGCY